MVPDKINDGGWSRLVQKRARRALSGGLAFGLRRLVVRVVDAPNKLMLPGTPQEYRIIQLWLRNAIHRDAHDVDAQVSWTRDGSPDGLRIEPGRWFNRVADGVADVTRGGSEDVDLLSSGNVEPLGVLVKYTSDRDAYVVTSSSHRRRITGRDWRDPAVVVPPGSYTFTIRLRSRDGRRATVKMRVENPGKDSLLQHRILSPR